MCGVGPQRKQTWMGILFFFCLFVLIGVSGSSASSVCNLGYMRPKETRELPTVSFLRSQGPSWSAFLSPSFKVFLCLFHMWCPGFSIVLSGKIREEHIYSSIQKGTSYCKFLNMMCLDLNFSKFVCSKCSNWLITLVYLVSIYVKRQWERSCIDVSI